MIKAKNNDINLGDLKFGKPYNFDFVITNTGTEAYMISNISVGCSACTTATLEKQTITVGESIKVHVEFVPGSRGINRKTITLTYEDISGKTDTLSLIFRATVND
jgi:hypothetical protein